MGDKGRFPLLLRQTIRTIGYWIRIVSLPEHRHLKVAYQCLLDSHLECRVDWVSHVKAILTETRNEQLWNQQYVTKRKSLLLSVRGYRNYINHGRSYKFKIRQKVLKYELTKNFKFDIHKEAYLTVIYNNNSMRFVAELKKSSHK